MGARCTLVPMTPSVVSAVLIEDFCMQSGVRVCGFGCFE